MANAKELLSKLTAPKKVAKEKAPSRPTTPVPEALTESFERWIGATIVSDLVLARKENESNYLEEELFNLFVNRLWETGSVPANPLMQIDKNEYPDQSAIFQVQNRFKVIVDDASAEGLTKVLSMFLPKEKAEALVANEIDTQPKVSIRRLDELVYGHYEGKEYIPATEKEQEAGRKLLALVMGEGNEELTEEERSIILIHENQIKVKQGFLDRVKTYCATEAELKGVLTVIRPTRFLSHAKFGISDTPEQQVDRLTEQVENILGRHLNPPQDAPALKKAA